MIAPMCVIIIYEFLMFLRNLMAKQDMSELGFRNVDEVDTTPDKKDKLESPPNVPKEKK
jgi:cytochrome c oxidase assembly protein subunit 19